MNEIPTNSKLTLQKLNHQVLTEVSTEQINCDSWYRRILESLCCSHNLNLRLQSGFARNAHLISVSNILRMLVTSTKNDFSVTMCRFITYIFSN